MEFVYDVTDVPASAGPTPWQTVGPFFHDALPYDTGSLVVGADRPGAFTLRGRVHDGGGEPIPDALVEVWQADESGRFATDPGIFEAPTADGSGVRPLRDGRRRPLRVHDRPAGRRTHGGGAAQAPHLAMSVFARGMLRRVVTRVYFDGGAENAVDPLLTSLDAPRAATLVAVPEDDGYRFDVRLQGADETVFLDVVVD